MASRNTLSAVREATVACRDVDRAVAFHRAALDWEVLESAPGNVLMGVPGVDTGKVRMVQAASDPGLPFPKIWEIGPRLLGVYSSDLERTRQRILDAGGWSGPVIGYELEQVGPAKFYAPGGPTFPIEILAKGPDDVIYTIPGYKERYPTPALEREPDRSASELHSVPIVVEDVDAALEVLHVAGGMELILDVVVGGPEVEELCELPPGATLRIGFVGGSERAPGRIELLQFYGTPEAPYRPRPVGVQRMTFDVAEPESMCDSLAAAGCERLAPNLLRGPGHIEIELRREPGP